jgi:MinD-like ATPase involved in chromosome partitioning or flagellar assembly
MAMAAHRHDRVVAVDACPDQWGPLADRAGVPGRGVGLRELVTADPPVASLADVRRFLASAGPTGLEVLPGLRDLTGPGLTAPEVGWTVDVMERLFPVVVVDAPPGWTQPVPASLLARADTVVLTAGLGTSDTAAQDALTALATIRPDLAAGAVVVLVEAARPRGLGLLRGLLRRGSVPAVPRLVEPVHAVVTIPYDPSLAAGAPVRWNLLRAGTRAAFEQLAAAVENAPVGVAGALADPGGPRVPPALRAADRPALESGW